MITTYCSDGSHRAAGQAAGDTGTLDLDEIRFHWGSAYDVGRDGSRPGRQNVDGAAPGRRGPHRHRDTPDALNVKIRAVWAREGTL